MDFDYSCFERPLNGIPMNCVINCKFYKILGNILISWATVGIWGCTVYWMCLIWWSLVYCFSMKCIFFQLHTTFKLVPEIVQCSPLHSEVIWWLASAAVSTVSLQYCIRTFLMLCISLFLSITYSKLSKQMPLSFILLLCCLPCYC